MAVTAAALARLLQSLLPESSHSRRSQIRQAIRILLLGKRVRDLRQKAGLTQEDMMSHGFERRYYQRIESGTVNLSLKSLNKIAKAFRVGISDLMNVE